MTLTGSAHRLVDERLVSLEQPVRDLATWFKQTGG